MKLRACLTVVVAGCCCAVALLAHSPSPTPPHVSIAFSNSELADVLHFYARLTGRKVWVELGLTGKVSVVTQRPVPQAEALAILRGSLLQEGFEIREVGDTEAFVSRVADPTMQGLRLTSPSPSPDLRGPLRKSRSPLPTPTP